ncbi:MAG TPA: tetratricopeptide repeat protein [Rhizomicrobium sp.]|nr:tetratricopeptide repeat protein [Rhizomicrobium sp.]
MSDGAAAQGLADRALVRPGLDAADQARLLGYRGLARNLEGDKEGALADLTRAIDAKNLTESEQSRFYLERGLVLDAMNRLDEASEDYSRALRLDPDSAPALNNRANIFRRLNRFEEARRDYLASLAAGNPAPEYPYYGLGQIAENQGNAEEAKGFYTRAIAANPGYTLAGERLAALGGTAPPQRAIVLIPPARGKAKEAAVPMRSPSRVATMPSKAVAVIKSADYSSRGARPGLRPALDNSAARGEQVQLGAWRSQAEAAEAWNRAVKIAGSVLSGLAPHIVQVDLPGKGRYYRLRTESVSAGQLCTQLAAKQIDCMPARD